jgi:Cu(I)/Ag(I) efflux system membrane fusion protein
MKRSHRPLLLLVAAASLLLLAGCSSPDRADGTSPEELWTCPMHPEYVADHPGTCPICNMDLVKKEAKPDPSGTGERPALELGPDSLRTAGVVTEAATVGRLARTIRASGSVVADERRLVRAQAKIAGWVERLEVNSTGQFVRKGAAAMAVYSPALLAAQSEYLLARDAANRSWSRRGGVSSCSTCPRASSPSSTAPARRSGRWSFSCRRPASSAKKPSCRARRSRPA